MENSILRIVHLLLLRYPNFGSDIAKVNIEFKSGLKCPTAATDGKNIYIDPNYFASLDDDDKIFLIAHELMHIKFKHMYRLIDKNGVKRNLDVWNEVTDEIINANLVRDGFKIKDGYLYNEEALKYSAEQLYEKRIKENKQMKEKTYIDDHSLWEEAFLEYTENQNEMEPVFDEQQEFEENRKVRTKIIQDKFKQKQKEISKTLETDSFKREVEKIGESASFLDWKNLLKKTTEREENIWSQRRSILENNFAYRLEEYEKLEMQETEIVLDTSGSIEESLLRNFLRECKNIFQNSKIKVGCFDTKFYGFTLIKKESDIDQLTFLGGGGTDFDVAVSAFSKNAKNKIIFTDGYAPMPKKYSDIIWIVFGNYQINPKGGKVIPVSLESLQTIFDKGRTK